MEFIGSLNTPLRIEMEAAITDLYDTRLGFFSPGHETASVKIIPEGCFHIIREMELPDRINKGEYLLHLALTEPDVQYYINIPRAVHIFAEGTPTETGRTIEYNSGAGWISLSRPRGI